MIKLISCVYCRKDFPRDQLTRDHVIAGSWYPQSTPTTVQRITVLSCADCNTIRYSAAERYLLLRLSACVDPQQAGAEGIWEKAKQAMDVSRACNDQERMHRQAAWDSFNQDTAEIDAPPVEGLLPSFATNFDAGSRTLVRIQADKLDVVVEKWGLGIHSHIWKQPATVDAEVNVFHITDADAADVFKGTEDHWKTIDCGPGIQIRYLAVYQNRERDSIYDFSVWGQFGAYVSIREHFESADPHRRERPT